MLTFNNDRTKPALRARLNKRGNKVVCGSGNCAATLGSRVVQKRWMEGDQAYRSPYLTVELELGYRRKDDGTFDMIPRTLKKKRENQTAIFRKGWLPVISGEFRHGRIAALEAPTSETCIVWCWECRRPNVLSSETLNLVDWSADPRYPHIQVKLPPEP